jgi:hypothetical protein
MCRERNALVPSLRAVPWRGCARTHCRSACGSHVDHHAAIAQSDIARARAACDRQLRSPNFARPTRSCRAPAPSASGASRARDHRAATRRLRLGHRLPTSAQQGWARMPLADAHRCG